MDDTAAGSIPPYPHVGLGISVSLGRENRLITPRDVH